MGRVENPMAKIVGDKIRDERLKQKLTQQHLADGINTTAATINRIENGVHYPSRKNLLAIARFLKKPKEFFTDPAIQSSLPTSNTIRLEDYTSLAQRLGGANHQIEELAAKIEALRSTIDFESEQADSLWEFFVIRCLRQQAEYLIESKQGKQIQWKLACEAFGLDVSELETRWRKHLSERSKKLFE